MNWDNVEMIRNAQASNQKRFDEEHIAVQERIEKAMQSEAFNQLAVPRMTELESMIFKMRSELIDYIVAHGLVDGLVWDGVLQPVENGKIVITKELVETITEKLGYYKEDDVLRFLEKYLPEHDYVSDGDYVHTDNNFRNEDVEKLNGIEDGAEVNKVIDILFNGTSVLDDGTRVATITVTPEDIKRWYESNADTNAFTDKEKAKLAGISDGAEVNRVDDVIVNGRSVLDENKKALLTKEVIKEAYEANPDTNAFTDAEKERLADINSLSVFILDASAIKDIESQTVGYETYGTYHITLRAKITLTSADKKTQVRTVDIQGYGAVFGDGYISGGELYLAYNHADSTSDGLQTVTIIGTPELKPVISVVVNRDNFNASSVSVEYLSFSRSAFNVIDVQNASGDSLVNGGVYKYAEPDLSGLVPYEGALKNTDLGAYKLTATGLTTKTTMTEGDSTGAKLVFQNGTSEEDSAMIQAYGADGDAWLSACKANDKTNLVKIKIGAPAEQEDATTKLYVDTAIVNKSVPYSGAVTNVDLNGKDLVNVGQLRTTMQTEIDDSLSLRTDHNITTSGVKIVPQTLGGARVEANDSTTLANLFVGTPTEDNHATTKKYVDDAVAGSGGGGGGAVTTCNAGEEDIRIVTVNSKITVSATVYTTGFTISSGSITGNDSASSSKSVVLYAGQRIIFARWYATASKTFYRSIEPVSGSSYYLVYDSSNVEKFSINACGVTYASAESFNIATSTSSSITSGDISGNSTSAYYKFT